MSVKNYKSINKKWAICILFFLCDSKNKSYKSIKNILQIPNTTLAIRLNDLVSHGYIEKFVYGSINKPHYTDYKITSLGLEYINSLMDLREL